MLLPLRAFGALALTCLFAGSLPASANGIQSKILANGLKVVVAENHLAPVVQTAIYYRFGSLYETPGKTGLAHGLEHMLFRGTSSISEGGLADIVSRLGATSDASTNLDYTNFYYVLPSSQVELGMHIEADRMRNALLRQVDWNVEKNAVLTEIGTRSANPFLKLIFGAREKAFAGTPFALGPGGKISDVGSAKAADLRRYYKLWYAPNNATLVVTGDVNPEKIFKAAAAYFGSIPSHKLPPRPVANFHVRKGQTLSLKADFPFAIADNVYATTGELNPDHAKLEVLAQIIGNERSPFYSALVKSGITLGYLPYLDSDLHTGLFHMLMLVAPGHTTDEASTAFEKTLQTVNSTGYPGDLVDAAKLALVSESTYAQESISGLGDRIGAAIGVQGTTPDAQDRAIQSVTVADINGVAKRVLATPVLVSDLEPEHPKPGHAAPPGGTGLSDSFSGRAPNGPIIEAAWVKSALARVPVFSSRVHPVAFQLDNGIKVLVQENHTTPTVTIRGNIEQSPSFDPAGKEGLGALAGAALGYGSAKYDFLAQRKLSDTLAASISLGSTFEAHGFAKDLPQLLDVLADGERNPAFPAQFVQLARQQMLASIGRRQTDSAYLSERAFDKLLLPPGDPELREPTATSVNAITIDDLKTYIANNYRPDLMTLAVVGDVRPDAARRALEKTFGSGAAASGPTPDVSVPALFPGAGGIDKVPAVKDVVNAHLGQAALSRSNPDFYAMALLNEVLGGSPESRLFQEVRTRRGLVYSIGSGLNAGRYRGIFEITFAAVPSKVRTTTSVVKEQLRLLQNQAPTAAELDRAKSELLGGVFNSEQSMSAVVGHVVNIGTNHLPLDYYQKITARYTRITPADIQRVAKQYLHPDKLVEVYEGPAF